MSEDASHRDPPRAIRFANALRAAGATEAQVERLAEALGVKDENDLAFACRTNRVRDLDGLGPELQAALAKALRRTPWSTRVRSLDHARRAAVRVLETLQREESALRLAVAGGVRRMAPWVEEVVLLATAHDPEALLEGFTGALFVRDVVRREPGVATVALADGTRVTLHAMNEDPSRFAVRLAALTGTPTHWQALVEQAAGLSMHLGTAGLEVEGAPAALEDEAALYRQLGLAPVPPELRETGWLEEPPAELVTMGDLQGLVHVHTEDAAGVFGVEDAARRAAHEGYAWLVVADRSPSAFPRGLAPEALARQRAAADRVNTDPEAGVRVFLGVEARVLPGGGLDWPADALEAADVVFGVVEDPPGEAPGAVTERFIAAVSHPRVHVLAHARPPSVGGTPPPDWERVFSAARAHGTALEISGASHRLPYDATWHAAARRAGLLLAPSADAHDVQGFDGALVTLGAARRGAWTAREVLPTRSARDFARWLAAPASADARGSS